MDVDEQILYNVHDFIKAKKVANIFNFIHHFWYKKKQEIHMHTHAYTHTYTHTEHFTINNTILHKYA